jgi:hypothetical protein
VCCRGSQKYNHAWGLQQLREVWTKNFKSCADADDDVDVQEEDVEMTVEGGASSVGAPVDEDAFEKQMRLSNEATTEQLRTSTSPRYVKPQALDQLEEWMKENPIPYISNDKFSQESIFQYWVVSQVGRLSGHAHVNPTYPDVVRMWRQFHGCPASGGGVERVFFSAGKQHDALKKRTMDKNLEITLKESINMTLPTCDDKGMMSHTGNTSSLQCQEVGRRMLSIE